MAQPLYDSISIAVSTLVGDGVAASGTSGKVFSSNDRLVAINKARGDVYTKLLAQLGIDEFLRQYPEFIIVEASVTISPTKDTRIRKVIKMWDTVSSLLIEEVPHRHFLSAKYNTFSKWYGTATSPRFHESGSAVTVLGLTLTSATVEFIRQPLDISHGGTDITEPGIWRQMIAERSAEILLQTQQI